MLSRETNVECLAIMNRFGVIFLFEILSEYFLFVVVGSAFV